MAALLLTNQKGTEIVFQRKRDDGVDLFVGVDGLTSPSTRLFVVQVKGTVSSDPTDWMRNVQTLFRGGSEHPYLPTCVVVVDIRDNKAQYAWIAEPIARPDGDGAILRIHPIAAFHELDDAAVTAIVRRVKAYYDVTPKQLLATG